MPSGQQNFSDQSTPLRNQPVKMDAFNNIPEHQRGEFMRHLEDQQMKDSLRMYNNLVESCFDKCVMTEWGGGFSSKQLTDGESKCVTNCSEKFMKLTHRAGFRFAENQAMKNAQNK